LEPNQLARIAFLASWGGGTRNKRRTISTSPTGCEPFSAPPHVKEQTTATHHRTNSSGVKPEIEFYCQAAPDEGGHVQMEKVSTAKKAKLAKGERIICAMGTNSHSKSVNSED
jgi:hypothetical protein